MPNCASAAPARGATRRGGERRSGAPATRSMPPARRGAASYDLPAIESDRRLQSALEEAGCIAVDRARCAGDSAGRDRRDAYAPTVADIERWRPISKRGASSPSRPMNIRCCCISRDRNVAASRSRKRTNSARRNADVAAGPAAAQRCFERFLARGRSAVRSPRQRAGRGPDLAPCGASLVSARSPRGRSCAPFASGSSDLFALSEERLSLRLFLRSLAHRDFFLQLAWFHPRTLDEPLQEKMRGFRWAADHTGARGVACGLRPAIRWLTRACGNCVKRVGCIRTSAPSRHRSSLSISASTGVSGGRVGSVAHRRRSGACHGQLAMDCGRRRRHGAVPAYLQSRTPTAPLRSSRRLRSTLDSRVTRQSPIETWYGRASNSPQLALALYAERALSAPTVDHGVAARAFLRRYREFTAPA